MHTNKFSVHLNDDFDWLAANANLPRFFYKLCFFQFNFSVPKLFHEFTFECCLGIAYTKAHFIFSIFQSMSRPSSTYVVSLWFATTFSLPLII